MNRDPNGHSSEQPGEGDLGGQNRHQIVDLDFLRGLIAAVDDSGIDSLEISRGGTKIRVAKSPPPATHAPATVAHVATTPAPSAPVHAAPAVQQEAAAPAPAPKSNLIEVKSPMVGTFYRAPSPEAPAYVEVGTRVTKGQTLCVLEAMKLMNELESDVQGTVREILVANAEPVEYGTVLFRIEPDA